MAHQDWADKRNAAAHLAKALESLGWTIVGFKEDRSDAMSDYFDPACWSGYATHPDKPGLLISTCATSDSQYSGKDIVEYWQEKGRDCEKCNGTGIVPNALTLEEARANPSKQHFIDYCKSTGGMALMSSVVSPLHYHSDGQPKCLHCHGKGHFMVNQSKVVGVHPTFEEVPRGYFWVLQKDGKIVYKGKGIKQCSGWGNEGKQAAAAIASEINALTERAGNLPTASEPLSSQAVGDIVVSIAKGESTGGSPGIEVRFSSPTLTGKALVGYLQSHGFTAKVGALGFRWSKGQKLWYARYNDKLWKQVHATFGMEVPSEELTPV